MEGGRHARQTLNWVPEEGKRKLGRPRKNRKKTVNKRILTALAPSETKYHNSQATVIREGTGLPDVSAVQEKLRSKINTALKTAIYLLLTLTCTSVTDVWM